MLSVCTGGAQDRRQHTSLPEEWPVLQLVHGETSAGHGKINPERAPRESKICGVCEGTHMFPVGTGRPSLGHEGGLG